MDSDETDMRKTLELIEEMAANSPNALYFLIITAINELRGAVDDGHASPELLRDLTVHTVNVAGTLPHTPLQ